MVKTYRSIQQWDQWLAQSMGAAVHQIECSFLTKQLVQYSGQHALLIGTPRQRDLLHACPIRHHVVLSPLLHPPHSSFFIESEFYKLPIASGSADLVLLPHTIEFVDNPRHLITEACRIVKPEGHLLMIGFNPSSFWGLKKWWVKSKHMPWSSHFIHPALIKKWLALADFELVKQQRLLFSLPSSRSRLLNESQWFEWFGRTLFPFLSGAYCLTFRAKVIPLTPIKMHWKQSIPALSSTLPRPTMRDMQ